MDRIASIDSDFAANVQTRWWTRTRLHIGCFFTVNQNSVGQRGCVFARNTRSPPGPSFRACTSAGRSGTATARTRSLVNYADRLVHGLKYWQRVQFSALAVRRRHLHRGRCCREEIATHHVSSPHTLRIYHRTVRAPAFARVMGVLRLITETNNCRQGADKSSAIYRVISVTARKRGDASNNEIRIETNYCRLSASSRWATQGGYESFRTCPYTDAT